MMDIRFFPFRLRSKREHARLERLLSLVNDADQPNLNVLADATRNIDILALNVKALGYELARAMSAALPPPTGTAPCDVALASKPSTQADLESDWAAYWCAEFQTPRVFHRKIWELAYVMQALHAAGGLAPGMRGLGFGCGGEPIASYLASRGVSSLITDLAADDRRTQGWAITGQHAASLDEAYHAHLVDRPAFDAHVAFRSMDMNHIARDLAGFDFCWSLCAFEHLGSIDQGLRFVEESLRPLRPGGTAVHTTEYNINPEGPTIDNWPTVLFQRRHFEALADRLRRRGHHVAPLDFDAGSKPLDRFIDVPPYHHHGLLTPISRDLGAPHHLKVAIDGFVATCFGIIVTKAG